MRSSRELSQGHRIKTAFGEELEIVEKLSEDGKSIVYKVKYNGEHLAMRWFYRRALYDPNGFYESFQKKIEKGTPSPSFLWPIDITEYSDDGFGYLMNLRPGEYKGFYLFLLEKVRFASLQAHINAALNIVDGFNRLLIRGLMFHDLNDCNFYINPQNGDILICDVENIAPFDADLRLMHKSRYTAPEIVLQKKHADAETVRFSLAVILYMLLFRNHPLEGRRTICPCLTEELDRKFYGEEPVFVWDPENDSNRPIRGVHIDEIKLWPVYPEFIREKFLKAFSNDALIGNSITKRVREKEWQEVFTELRGLTVKCFCGRETFVDPKSTTCTCIKCGKTFARPQILKVGKYNVALVPRAKVYACHTQYDSDDFRAVTGEVVSSINNSTVLGLKNNSGISWEAILPNGMSKAYTDGQVIKLGKGMKINFGNCNVAEIY